MNVSNINAHIAKLLGADARLRAEEENGVIFLRDNVNEAEITCETMDDVAHLIHEWAIFTGYTIEGFKEFTMQKYAAILADPPWKSQVGGGRIKRGADRHYPLMSTKDLCAMSIPAAEDAVLFLWSTWNDIPDALQVITAWGFRYVSGLPWVKLTNNGVVAIGLGQYLRGCSEPLLFATKGRVQRLQGASPLALLMEENTPLVTPRMEHSRKPQTAYELVECFSGPYLEVFARSRREGWDVLGNEVDKYAQQAGLL